MDLCKPLFKYGIFERLINFHILGSQVIYIFGISIGHIMYGIALILAYILESDVVVTMHMQIVHFGIIVVFIGQ